MSREVVIFSAFKKDLKKLKGKDAGKLKQLIGYWPMSFPYLPDIGTTRLQDSGKGTGTHM